MQCCCGRRRESEQGEGREGQKAENERLEYFGAVLSGIRDEECNII